MYYLLALKNRILLTFVLDMRRIGIILVFCAFWATDGFAVSRSSVSSESLRSGTATQRVRTQAAQPKKTVRVATPQTKTVSRSAKNTKTNTVSRSVASRTQQTARSAVVARAASDTQIGAEYEQCKNAFFTCMDQFCQLKNDEYRRCSCSDRITSLQKARDNLQQASEQLNAFNENLDIVGKTAAQATAMNTASEGELALTKDNSASKALLEAILNSIRGTDSRVENNRLSDLNSIDLSFDSANSFGVTDVGQVVASYNGQALYSAVYPQCRDAVKSMCNNASLQRAVNAYLMAIEQDCNTVQSAITNKQKQTNAAIRESSSMLDMARAENHRNHNSDDIATCLANVESAVLSEEVCGSNYHKCLDNGEYIDVSTGSPIAGVEDFYKLGKMLTFASGRSNAEQNLAQNPANRSFVINFEKRVKQFADTALDKCADDADTVWADYLNKALLDIYYAQQAKVDEIKQGCFDFVSACYMNGDTAMTNAMQGLVAAQTTSLKPDVLALNKSLCSDYIASCNNMFDGNIVAQYIDNKHDTDSLAACRAVAKQCFDNYGGQNYENFYNPSSGLFEPGRAIDWFSLYEYECGINCVKQDGVYKSECAKQLAAIDACKNNIEQVFGGFDYFYNSGNYSFINIYNMYSTLKQNETSVNGLNNRVPRSTGVATEIYNQITDILQNNCLTMDGRFMTVKSLNYYQDEYNSANFCQEKFSTTQANGYTASRGRYGHLYESYSIGKKVSYQTLVNTNFNDTPIVSMPGGGGLGMSPQVCLGGACGAFSAFSRTTSYETHLKTVNENICPYEYGESVDVQSWGACSCWENGGRRSNNGTAKRCQASFPVRPVGIYKKDSASPDGYKHTTLHGLYNTCIDADADEEKQYVVGYEKSTSDDDSDRLSYIKTLPLWDYNNMYPSGTDIPSTEMPTDQDWCTAEVDDQGRVCPFGVKKATNGNCEECRVGWGVRTDTSNSNVKKCCPGTAEDIGNSNNNNGIYNLSNGECCPVLYSYNSGTGLCEYASASPVEPVEPLPLSSEIMGTGSNNSNNNSNSSASFPEYVGQ